MPFLDKLQALQNWLPVKIKLATNDKLPAFKEGEIWWSAAGENIGVEINGKNAQFLRPVLIYHKFNRRSFLGIYLTSQPKIAGTWYVPFVFHGRHQNAVLNQIRAMSALRLYRRMGTIDESDLLKIRQGFLKLYSKNNPL